MLLRERRLETGSGSLAQSAGLFLARFCSSAWVGAALLFVVVGVTEVTRGGFDNSTKDRLVAIRFPAFYVFGFALVGIAWMGTWVAYGLSRGRRTAACVALSAVLVLMLADYVWVYLPLLKTVMPPGQTRGPDFVRYHEASKWINLAGLVMSLIAVMVVNWPGHHEGSTQESAARPSA